MKKIKAVIIKINGYLRCNNGRFSLIKFGFNKKSKSKLIDYFKQEIVYASNI